MCDPVSLGITAASMLAKSYFQNKAAGQVGDAQVASQQAFNKDVDAQRKKAAGEFQNSVNEAGQASDTARTNDAVAARETAYQPKFDQNVLLPGQGDANHAVRAAIVTAQNKGVAENAGNATRRANLDAFGDADLGKNIALLQDANRIKTAGNFAGGAYPVLQANLGRAAHAGDASSSTGDLLSAIGNIGAAATAVDWGGMTPSDPITKDAFGNTIGTFNKADLYGPPARF